MHSQSLTTLSLEPMGRTMATELVRRLLVGYPNLTAPDPEGYLAALVDAMEGYPQWAGEHAVMRVDEENKKFPPTEKELRSWLKEYVRPFVFERQYNLHSMEQLAESNRLERDSKEETPEQKREAVERHLRPAQEKYGLQFTCIGDAASNVLDRKLSEAEAEATLEKYRKLKAKAE